MNIETRLFTFDDRIKGSNESYHSFIHNKDIEVVHRYKVAVNEHQYDICVMYYDKDEVGGWD